MAGHSKWANIKYRKDRQDKKRAKIWTKIIREITVAARMGQSANPAENPRLRLAWDKALAANMPKDTMERAAKRGIGADSGENYEEITYEGYGPGGVAVFVECMTDNKVRTVAEVRHAFSKNGGNLGTDGSVAYLFSKVGTLLYAPGSNEEAIMEVALELGADDVVVDEDGSIEVLTAPEAFQTVLDGMKAKGLVPEEAEITMRASTQIPVEGEVAEKLVKLIDTLEDLDDVQAVYHNAELPEGVLA
ncbi:MAG: YebC/PmpR family DNA-binding transcriptional regulator [Gammaproteobacteria bacterium]|nr:YebC/PmpR family DNA-binding transcriptional regulator [Gammaproteobacteria bacterium]